jgi:hypothetical protein
MKDKRAVYIDNIQVSTANDYGSRIWSSTQVPEPEANCIIGIWNCSHCLWKIIWVGNTSIKVTVSARMCVTRVNGSRCRRRAWIAEGIIASQRACLKTRILYQIGAAGREGDGDVIQSPIWWVLPKGQSEGDTTCRWLIRIWVIDIATSRCYIWKI